MRRQLYGWLDPRGKLRVSRYPPDSPVRPSAEFESIDQVNEMAFKKKAKILWWPPLPNELARQCAQVI